VSQPDRFSCVFSYPGVMEHAEQAALALYEAGALEAFVTSFVFKEPSTLARIAAALPGGLGDKVLAQLRRRSMPNIPADHVHSLPMLEILRTAIQKAGAGVVLTDLVWDVGSHHFDQVVASRFVPRAAAVIAFEYTALASFERAGPLGRAKVLHLPSLDNRAFRDIELREKAEWPELIRPQDAYFGRKFERRQARRQAEIALADLILTNSSLTKASHVAGGADPAKIIVVPLAAPPPITAPTHASGGQGPLRVLWSGSFILRKGARYMLQAWRQFGSGQSARLDIYGHVGLPSAVLDDVPQGIMFHGSIPRDQLLDALADCDVLVFPTLSDGFGMAVTEALSRGVPVITTDQAGAADLIEHGKNGLIIPAADARALSDALSWCLDNRHALGEMRQAALDTARRRQWSDYRRDHMLALDSGLRRAGFSPDFGLADAPRAAP
jgi:glycosyltransferase involved in cell wall biosynthesis